MALLIALAMPAPLLAHPGSGIVVDRAGQVYFVDTGSGLWKVDTHGALVRIAAPRFHWLTLDARDLFTGVPLPSGGGGEIVRAGAAPTLLLGSDQPLTIAPDGNLYYPAYVAGSALEIRRLRPSGGVSVLARLALPHVNGLTSAPDGSLYFAEDDAVRRISVRGEVSTIVERMTLDHCPRIPGTSPSSPLLRGLAVDAKGTVYVAASGCGRVLSISRDGRIATALQLASPWSPTAVAVHNGDLYVLEYLHTAVEDRQQWLPRVRRLSPDGSSVIIAAITRR